MSYEELSGLITVLLPGLGQLLEPIQKYCVKHQLPPLTSIVVSRTNGIPGEGFIAAENVPEAQANTFSHNWIQEHCPMPEEF
jgi:putative restriction endonuclease